MIGHMIRAGFTGCRAFPMQKGPEDPGLSVSDLGLLALIVRHCFRCFCYDNHDDRDHYLSEHIPHDKLQLKLNEEPPPSRNAMDSVLLRHRPRDPGRWSSFI